MTIIPVALLTLSCGHGGGDPCKDVTCSNHGQCQVVDDQAVCNCETGFIANGLECIPEPTFEDFIDGAQHDPCMANAPVCQTTAGCVMDETKYIEGHFPGFINFIVNTTANATIVVRIFFETRGHPGEDTEIIWYEPGCSEAYSYESAGVDIFEIAGEDRVFEQEQTVLQEGSHLVDVYSDSTTHYYLRVETK
jgi:hypothetical protein